MPAPDVPRVSIVIPAYNPGAYLDEAIASARAQDHPDVEIVVVDDGSTDGTPESVRRDHPDVLLLTKRNGGTASARNLGVRSASGDYVVFLDADDRLRPSYVSRCLAHLRANPHATYVYTQEQFFGDLEYVSAYPDFDPARLAHENFVNPSSLLPRHLVLAHPFTEGQRMHEDWDFYLKLLGDGHLGVLLDEPLKEYRRHPQSKQARAGRYSVRMPMAKLRIHVRHRALLGDDFRRVLAEDVARVSRGAVQGLRTGVSLSVKRALGR